MQESYLKSINAAYIEELLEKFQSDPESIDSTWRYFFEGLELGAKSNKTLNGEANLNVSSEAKVAELIHAYRENGRLAANINPLSEGSVETPLLGLARFGLTNVSPDKNFTAGNLLKLGPAPLTKILEHLRETYCSSIAVEYTHIGDHVSRQWLQERMEDSRNRENLTPETRHFIYQRLCESETFERFLHTRYVAQKRFSLEGGEALIPTLDRLIEVGGESGATQMVLGMAHRGRLNVLHNTFGKKAEYILTEFEEDYEGSQTVGVGDVKYHMGFSSDIKTRFGHEVHLSLAHNPSHLEFVNPVVEGIVRSKQRALKDKDRHKVIPILIHGDAAFAGEGVVYETLNLSQVSGYRTGGTVHIVLNNQVGFTTAPESARSTTYATDVAMMLEVPIFHVNGDDPEALWFVAKLAMEYRQQFKRDVIIDLICYRKYGHNEGDEPAFTQPIMYRQIKDHASTRELYAQKLLQGGMLSEVQVQAPIDQVIEKLTEAQKITRTQKPRPFNSAYESKWKNFKPGDVTDAIKTCVAPDTLKLLTMKICSVPGDFSVHPKLERFLEARSKMVENDTGMDFGMAEAMAFATLLHEGHPVRITGQDSERGTFSHRHSVLNDVQNGKTYTPLNNLGNDQAEFIVRNSTLSETAVLGFEYGWSLADPTALVIWEAQYGDFANVAQVIIDQFIAASEAKWQRSSGLVMLLPHGYEGQGPEHSSARLERFLQLCGENNLAVCNFTQPAQLFHALRRQVKRNFRKPLVVMSPKSLLRHPRAVSSMADLTEGSFMPVIDDPTPTLDRNAVNRIVLCSGKLFFELLEEKEKSKLDNVALIRIEQLYPWPEAELTQLLKRYPKVKEIIWAQEEPRNMGAWTHVFGYWAGTYANFQEKTGLPMIQYVGRTIAAAPATGGHKLHLHKQKLIVQTALGLVKG